MHREQLRQGMHLRLWDAVIGACHGAGIAIETRKLLFFVSHVSATEKKTIVLEDRHLQDLL